MNSATMPCMPLFTRDGRRASRARLDARFLIGLAIVVASIAGVWGVVHAARETAPVLAASSAIVPGQTITAADVVEIGAQLASATDDYIAPADLEEGLIATRPIGEGELVPAGAVGATGDLDVTTVVVRSALDVPADVAAGAAVELWAAPVVAPGEHGEPQVIVPRAIVANIGSDDGVVNQEGAVLELVVPREAVGSVLQHTSDGSALSAVPVIVPRETNGAEEPAAEGNGDESVGQDDGDENEQDAEDDGRGDE